MALTLLLFFASAAFIYLSCEFFVNGVEWVGHRLKLTETATGTLLAAFGTALPETVVTFVAVIFGRDDAQREIGVGAALGGPLALSTLAYAVVGLALIGAKGMKAGGKGRLDVDYARLSHDQAWFLSIFVCKLGLGLVAFHGKPLLGLAFLVAYGVYVWKELGTEGVAASAHDLEPLKLRPHDRNPSLTWALVQTALALGVIFAASHIFVGQLGKIGPWLGLPPQLVALLFSPIATELPETMNALIWVRQGKTNLALANISGAMMIQATIPTALGLFRTPWLLTRPLILAGAFTTLAVTMLFLMFRNGKVNGRRLSLGCLIYLVFAATLIFG